MEFQANNDMPDMLERRPAYDTSKDFSDLVRPHFYAINADGDSTDLTGEPDSIVLLDGRAKVRLSGEGEVLFLDPLALESELVGEHPVHKLYRLLEMGIPASEELDSRLDSDDVNTLFATLEFEFQRRRWASGVLTDVFVDGTFLVIPDQLPSEWKSDKEQIASPTHLHLNSRAMSGGSSPGAREYELEILSLPFEDQRYPPAPLARKQCDVYRESLAASDYLALMESVGYRFTPGHVTGSLENAAPFAERAQALLWDGSGPGVQYFGFEGYWIADAFRSEEVPWLEECDTAGGLRDYPGASQGETRHYLTIRRSLEPDKKQRYRILEVDESGVATELYTAPGIILMAQPLPFNDRAWLFSTEGWTPSEDGEPADPRWQAVYLVDLDNPDEYVKVPYPIGGFPRAPEAGLYGSSPRMVGDGSFLFNTLYGFKDEGGGIWVVDVSAENFYVLEENFSRIVSWDHTLSWMPLGRLDNDPTALYLFMTGKEVADDFAMTANVLRIREDGLGSAVEESRRLLQMVGWNPVPFGWQKLSDTRYRMLVETHYNYESSLMPRAKGVYIVPVNLEGEQEAP
ncbi:MAG: hypothetical protein F4X65_00205 [Chloroflexi bacterium]|nr:hypothetical protein [Chloroflexota bacterium]